MARTQRELAGAMGASGWRLEVAARKAGKKKPRWTMVHVATKSTISCMRLREIEEMWRELCRIQRMTDTWARTVARWYECGKGVAHELSRNWLASGNDTLPVELFTDLAALPKPGEPRHWFRESASMGVVGPPGGHDLLGLVRDQLALVQHRHLNRSVTGAGRPGGRQRL